MARIEPLQRVSPWDAWPHEAHDFTPWLASHIGRLADVLNLKLERVRTEVTLPRSGRVDICAQQAETDAIVVIENQLGRSDDSHCLRLLGYAANADASILVWVAGSFSSYHRSILEWLNEADTIDVYAVAVRAYRAGEALAADFRTVVEPRSRPPTPRARTTSTLYADFYRPLVARLGRHGLLPVGRGGWRGRWRSFQTGHTGAVFGTGSTEVGAGKGMVFLQFIGTGRQDRFRALRERREAIEAEVGRTVSWQDKTWFGVMLEGSEAFDVTAPEEQLETAREWMADSLLRLRRALQPHLDEVMRAGDAELSSGGSSSNPA